ncbi:MAG: ribosome maturation factor RimM [Firmicutes bacterium]|nr:ribosome maturation factor RimM [Bacillota bacterium]
MVAIGKIVKAQGIRGEVKVMSLTRDVTHFAVLKNVYIDGVLYDIKAVRISGDFAYLLLDGISDRNTAESLRNKQISIERDKVKPLDTDEYYISDLIGCRVVTTDGLEIGTLAEVIETGTADVFVVKSTDGKDVLFPHLTRVVVGVDLGSRVVTVDKTELDKVIVIN